MPNVNGQVTPKSESGSPPTKKAGQAKQQLQKQQHPKKSSFQKQNGISKGTDTELSTVSAVTKAQASSKLQDSSQPPETAAVVREPKEAGKLKQQSPKLQSSRKAAFRKQRAPPKAMDTDLPAAPSLSLLTVFWGCMEGCPLRESLLASYSLGSTQVLPDAIVHPQPLSRAQPSWGTWGCREFAL